MSQCILEIIGLLWMLHVLACLLADSKISAGRKRIVIVAFHHLYYVGLNQFVIHYHFNPSESSLEGKVYQVYREQVLLYTQQTINTKYFGEKTWCTALEDPSIEKRVREIEQYELRYVFLYILRDKYNKHLLDVR